MNNHKPPGTPGQPIQVNIPKNQTELLPCRCGCGRFIPVMEGRLVSAVLSPTGKDHVFLNQVALECQECGLEYTIDGLVKLREEAKQRGPVLVQPTSENDQ